MGLLFCCPACSADLRVNPATAVRVLCPRCGEPIRVPRRPHPCETDTDAPALPAPLRGKVLRGVELQSASVWAFVVAATSVIVSLLFRVTVGRTSSEEFPGWLPPIHVTLAVVWFTFGCAGCVLRLRGYLLCRAVAETYALGGWVLVSVAGATLSACGVAAVVPLVIGRPIVSLPPVAGGFLLVGLSAGLIGVLFEFAFLAVMNRILWASAGAQAASQTTRYAVTVVFGMVAGMAALCTGLVALALVAGGKDANTDAADVSVSTKVIGVLVLLAVSGICGWTTWRFARLLHLTRQAIHQYEPTPDPPVPSG